MRILNMIRRVTSRGRTVPQQPKATPLSTAKRRKPKHKPQLTTRQRVEVVVTTRKRLADLADEFGAELAVRALREDLSRDDILKLHAEDLKKQIAAEDEKLARLKATFADADLDLDVLLAETNATPTPEDSKGAPPARPAATRPRFIFPE